jgi:tRNA-dihydrouridine synthase B
VVDAWIPRLLEMEPVAITLHGRTLRQAYSGRADWEQIGRAAELAKGTNTLILGNGDVASRTDAESRAATYGVDGILIGRASMGKPFLFRKDEPIQEKTKKLTYGPDLSQIALEHAYLYEQTFRTYAHYRFLPMRKHLAWYIRDVRGANHLRASLVQTHSPQEAEALLRQHKTLTNGVYQSGLIG